MEQGLNHVGRLGSAQWRRWSKDGKESYSEKTGRVLVQDYRAAEVAKAVIRRYPNLHELAEDALDSLDLAWHESEIAGHAMRLLRGRDIPSLPVHDCLIVPVSKVQEAGAALIEGFQLHFESDLVRPGFKVSRGPSQGRTKEELLRAALEL